MFVLDVKHCSILGAEVMDTVFIFQKLSPCSDNKQIKTKLKMASQAELKFLARVLDEQ
jgi:hypothetical protein